MEIGQLVIIKWLCSGCVYIVKIEEKTDTDIKGKYRCIHEDGSMSDWMFSGSFDNKNIHDIMIVQ